MDGCEVHGKQKLAFCSHHSPAKDAPLTFSFCGYLLVQHRDALPDTMTPIPHPGSDFP